MRHYDGTRVLFMIFSREKRAAETDEGKNRLVGCHLNGMSCQWLQRLLFLPLVFSLQVLVATKIDSVASDAHHTVD